MKESTSARSFKRSSNLNLSGEKSSKKTGNPKRKTLVGDNQRSDAQETIWNNNQTLQIPMRSNAKATYSKLAITVKSATQRNVIRTPLSKHRLKANQFHSKWAASSTLASWTSPVLARVSTTSILAIRPVIIWTVVMCVSMRLQMTVWTTIRKKETREATVTSRLKLTRINRYRLRVVSQGVRLGRSRALRHSIRRL